MKSLTATASNLLRSSRARRWLQGIVIAIVLLFLARALYDLSPRLLAYDWQWNPWYMGLAFALLIMRGPVPVYGWQQIVRKLGYTLSMRQSIRIVYYSSLANFIPGSVWYAVGRVYLAERAGVPRMISAVSIGLETIMLVLGAALVSALSLFAWRDPPVWAAILLLAAFIAVLLQPNLLFGLLNWLLARAGRTPIEAKLSAWDMLRLLWPFVLHWLLFGIMSFALVAALYPALSIAQAPAVAGFFTASWLAGYLAVFVPQGLVVRESLITIFLTTFIGVPAPVAAAVAVLSRAWSILGIALWAAIARIGTGNNQPAPGNTDQ